MAPSQTATTRFFELITNGAAQDVARQLTEEPALISVRSEGGMSPVLVAAYHRKEEIVKLLLAQKPRLDVFEAAALGLVDRLRELVASDREAAAAFSVDGFTALHLASYFDHPEAVRTLLEHGAEVNVPARNPSRVAPLHSAAAGARRQVVELLLAHGADANACQEGGYTPLHAAVQRSDLGVVHLLLGQGADASRQLDDGRRPADMLGEDAPDELRRLLQ